MASTIRSFIAVDLPAEQKRTLGRMIRKLAEKWPEYRWSTQENLHLTLNFLGEVPDEKLPQVCQILRETVASHPPFSFQLTGLGAFPKNSRPRVIWCGVGQGKSELSKLYYDLRDKLDDLRLERDRKAFRPHITLGRIRNNERWSESVTSFLDDGEPAEMGEVDVNEVVLFSSFVESAGPTYTPMDRVSL